MCKSLCVFLKFSVVIRSHPNLSILMARFKITDFSLFHEIQSFISPLLLILSLSPSLPSLPPPSPACSGRRFHTALRHNDFGYEGRVFCSFQRSAQFLLRIRRPFASRASRRHHAPRRRSRSQSVGRMQDFLRRSLGQSPQSLLRTGRRYCLVRTRLLNSRSMKSRCLVNGRLCAH